MHKEHPLQTTANAVCFVSVVFDLLQEFEEAIKLKQNAEGMLKEGNEQAGLCRQVMDFLHLLFSMSIGAVSLIMTCIEAAVACIEWQVFHCLHNITFVVVR